MDALYSPNLSLPSPAWTNPVALYFDRIGIIAPSAYEPALSDDRTKRLIEVGLVAPMFSGLFEDHEVEDDYVTERLIRRAASRRAQGRASSSDTHIHAGKLAYTSLAQRFVDQGLLRERGAESPWLTGEAFVVDALMAVLAQRIVRSGEASSIITDSVKTLEITSGEAASPLHSQRRLQAVTRLLPAAPWVSPEQLVKFKNAQTQELRAFRHFVEFLARRDAANDPAFDARLDEAERLRDHLVGELDAIDARSRGPSHVFTMAGIVAPMLEASFFSMGINVAQALHLRGEDRRRGVEIRGDGLAYAALARSQLRARTAADVLA